MSEHLSERGIPPHVVLERHRIAERWRSMRWDSLVANGPAWHDRFPGLEFTDIEAGSFPPSKEQVADYFVAYARRSARPSAAAWRSSQCAGTSEHRASTYKHPMGGNTTHATS